MTLCPIIMPLAEGLRKYILSLSLSLSHTHILHKTMLYKRGQKNSLTEKFIWWRHISCWWIFWPMGSKYCNTDGIGMWIARGWLCWKNESILVSLWTFQPTLVHIAFPSNICTRNFKSIFLPPLSLTHTYAQAHIHTSTQLHAHRGTFYVGTHTLWHSGMIYWMYAQNFLLYVHTMLKYKFIWTHTEYIISIYLSIYQSLFNTHSY